MGSYDTAARTLVTLASSPHRAIGLCAAAVQHIIGRRLAESPCHAVRVQAFGHLGVFTRDVRPSTASQAAGSDVDKVAGWTIS
jgi:hypothetical protein